MNLNGHGDYAVRVNSHVFGFMANDYFLLLWRGQESICLGDMKQCIFYLVGISYLKEIKFAENKEVQARISK